MNDATQQFIASVRAGLGMFAPPVQVSESGQNPSLTAAMQRGLQKSAMWLTEGALRGYDTADFSDIPEEAQAVIRTSVARLRGFIAQFSPDDAPPRTIYEAAAPVFQELATTLAKHYSRDTAQLRTLADADNH